MDQKQVLALAKQGNPQAIAILMNRHLQAKDITAKVSARNNTLQIVLESSQVPNQQEALLFVVKGLTSLGFGEIAKIYGRQMGEELPAWVQEIDFSQSQPSINQSQIEETISCPKCQSTQVLASKKGFGLGKAAVGAILLGPIGLAGGFLGSNQVFLTCLNCGNQWKVGQGTSPKIQAVNAKPTKAQVIRLTFIARVVCGIITAILVGLLGSIFFGYLAWIVAIIVGLAFLSGVDEFTASLQGDCPYCGKETMTSLQQKKFDCSHCKGNITVTKLSPGQYEFNPISGIDKK